MRVLAPDLRGPTVDALVDEVHHLVAREPALVVGLSMGAAAALALACGAPTAVAALVLVAPAVTPAGLPDYLLTMLRGRADALAAGGLDGLRSHLRQVGHPRMSTEDVIAGVEDQARRSTVDGLLALWRGFPGRLPWQTWDDLAPVAIPAAVIGWRGDPVHPFEIAELTARSLADATLIEVPIPTAALPDAEITAAILDVRARSAT